MKLFSKLLCGAALLASTATAGTAEMFISQSDNAALRATKTDNGDGTYNVSLESLNPELFKIDSYTCHHTSCSGFVNFQKNGPLNFNGINFSTLTPYEHAYIDSENPGVLELDLSDSSIYRNTEIRAHYAVSHPKTSPTEANTFYRIFQTNVDFSVYLVTDDEVKLSFGFSLQPQQEGVTTQYQDAQVVVAATRDVSTLGLWQNGKALGEDYIIAEGNKGVSSIIEAGDVAAFLADYWNQSSGHYSALNFFTNGTDRFAQGLDLSDYNTINFEMGCKKGVTVEAFFGRDSDSSQNFLTDIVCDDFTMTYSFDISNYNRSDIQTALWFHIPTWKNASFNDYRIWMNTFEVTLEK